MLKMVGKFALVASVAAVMVACGGKNDEAIKVVAADLQIAVANTPTGIATAKSVIAAVASTPVKFTAAVPVLGTTSATTFTLAPTTATSPAADIGNFAVADISGNSYSGAVEAGSCILVIKVSSFAAPSPYAVGGRIPVNPCSFTARVANTNANGAPAQRDVVVTLGNSNSTIRLPVTVSADGQVSFGNNVITTVPVVPATGG